MSDHFSRYYVLIVYFQLCDSALADVLKLLNVETVVGVGKYAADRARRVISMDEELKGIQESSSNGIKKYCHSWMPQYPVSTVLW